MTTDKPALVFAHANGMPTGSYRKFLAPLAEDFTVFAPARIGHQPGTRVGRNWSGLLAEMEAFVAPLPKPLVAVGHSMGAVLLFMLAAQRPQWFRALIMLDPPLITGWHRWLFTVARAVGQGDRLTPAGKSKYRRDHWPDRAAVEAYFAGNRFFQSLDADCLHDYISAGVEAADGGWQLSFRVATEVAIFRETPLNLHHYPRLRIPGLLINGADSEPVFIANARRHVRRHGMRWLQLPGAHMFPLQQPLSTAAALRQALKEMW